MIKGAILYFFNIQCFIFHWKCIIKALAVKPNLSLYLTIFHLLKMIEIETETFKTGCWCIM